MSALTHSLRALVCVPFLALGFTPPSLWAQLPQAEISEHPELELALAKPFMDDGFGELGFASMVLDARFNVPVRTGTSLFIQSGLASAAIGSVRSTTLGNLSLGAAFGDPSRTFGSLSITLPTAQEFGEDDFATGLAWLNDFEHPEAYLPDLYALDGTVAGTGHFRSGATLRWRVSGVVVGSKEEGTDTEFLTRYGVGGSVPVGQARFGADLSGYALLSESGLSFSERTVHGLGVRLGLPDVRGRPEIFVRAPLDDALNDIIKATVGIRVTF